MTIANIFKKFFTTLGIIVLELFKLRPWMVWDMDGCIANIYEHDDYLGKLNDKRFFVLAKNIKKKILLTPLIF